MCNCYDRIQKMLHERFKEMAPEGSERFEVELGGYVFGVTNEGQMTHRSSNEAIIHYMAPKKSGGMKKVTQKTFIRASFCPFCGKQYDDAA